MLVVGLLVLAIGLAAFAVWFQWGQTRRSLDFLGADAARSIQSAPRVELWSLEPRGGEICRIDRRDVSQAPGLVHLRRGLVEDVNYRWDVPQRGLELGGPAAAATGLDGPLPPGAWDVAIAFSEGPGSQPAIVLAFDLDGDGFMTAVGRPGRLALGPIAPGLRDWIKATKTRFSASKSGF